MIKEFAKYMTRGKEVESSYTGNVYKFVEDMKDEKEFVKAVNMENWERYHLLSEWIINWDSSMEFRERFTKNIEDCKVEKQSYEEELRIEDILPHNMVRFITSDYQTKFEVKDLSTVSVNGTVARVAYLDSHHFTFVDKIKTNFYGGCFHICQFAEICERDNIEVKPVN